MEQVEGAEDSGAAENANQEEAQDLDDSWHTATEDSAEEEVKQEAHPLGSASNDCSDEEVKQEEEDE